MSKITPLCKLITLITGLSIYSTSFAAIKTDLGTANIDLRLRYEHVNQENPLKDADGLTLRTKLNFKTIEKNGFSAFLELENSFAIIDNYNNTIGDGMGQSVIADPDSSEIDQAYFQYQNEGFTTKIGRQVITFDNHRFVGHVGWRQDKQTFDAANISYLTDKLTMTYAYINKRNRIFADKKDIKSRDHLINFNSQTSLGKISAYGYLLEEDKDTDNALDTWGIRLAGKKKANELSIIYALEYATQTKENAGLSIDTSYLLLEAGIIFQGVTVKGGYEALGSDNGIGSFITPLATLHKFNGWSDQFLGTPAVGLNDIYLNISGKAAGGKWAVIFHNYSADKTTSTVDDLGSEINLVYSKALNKTYSAGIKYAAYSAGDNDAGKVDTDKLWVWVGAKF